MQDIWKALSIIAQIITYILAVIIIIQITRLLFGGSWAIEDIILALVIFNLTATFTIMGYLIHLNRVIYGHIEWHKGKETQSK